MKRLGRIRFFVYSVLTILVLLGAARLVLSSEYVANKVADRLGALLGVPVRVTGVDIALGGSSSVQGLQIYEADGTRPDAPWASADDMQADFSAVDMFGDDAMPKRVILNNANVVLLFDKDGTLLTRLPKASDSTQAMPKLRLENARVTIKQEGRLLRPHVVTGVTADFSYATGTFSFEGTCTDPDWGAWKVSGSYDTVGDVFRLSLRTNRVEVTDDKLKLLPFIPEEVWEEVKIASGVTPVDLELSTHGAEPVKYKISLKPEDTKLHISSIDLDADQTSGEVVIEDAVVRLRNVKGSTANGAIGTEASLDFRDERVSRLTFETIWVHDVDLNRLPESWKLKQNKITSKLTGDTKLNVQVKAEGVSLYGDGKVIVKNIMPDGLPFKLKKAAGEDFQIEWIIPEFLKPLLKTLSR